MKSTVIGISGTYRKEGITSQAVTAILGVAAKSGMQTQEIHLTDRHIEFCSNCRACTNDDATKPRGQCTRDDEMESILSDIENADAIVLASPINFGTVTAIMKRFIERLIVLTYWPWGKLAPQKRITDLNKKAIIVTSSSCPALLGRLVMPGALRLLKTAANLLGARVIKTLYFGGVCGAKSQELTPRQLRAAKLAAAKILE